MAKADFYILNTTDHHSRLNFLCRLVEKAVGLNHQIYIHTSSEQQAIEIDDLLWSYKLESFLPHSHATQEHLDAPIVIGFGDSCGDHEDLLINLARDLPSFYKKFERIAEIVIQNDIILKELRAHYRQIQKDGIEAIIHDFRKTK